MVDTDDNGGESEIVDDRTKEIYFIPFECTHTSW